MDISALLDPVWFDLEPKLDSVFKGIPKNIAYKEYMGMYTSVYDYCTAVDRNSHEDSGPLSSNKDNELSPQMNAGQELYKKLNEFLQQQVDRIATDNMSVFTSGGNNFEHSSLDGDLGILKCYYDNWQKFLFSRKVLNGIAKYLNRFWVKRMKDEKPEVQIYEIHELALVEWKKQLFDKIKKHLTNAILRLVLRSRRGEEVNSSLLKGVIESYVELGVEVSNRTQNSTNIKGSAFTAQQTTIEEGTLKVYREDFEKIYIKELEKFYSTESEEFIANNNVVSYMTAATEWLAAEEARVESFLHKHSLESVKDVSTKVIVTKHLETIQGIFCNLLDQWQTDDLMKMFNLSNRCPNGLESMKKTLQDYIQKKGVEAISAVKEKAAEDPKLYICTIIQLHDKHRKLVETSFNNDIEFKKVLDKSCESFINDNAVTQSSGTGKSAELLVKFCDNVLKKDRAVNTGTDTVTDSLDQVMTVFQYLQDKDVFSKIYRNYLQRRLINMNSIGDDDEDLMLKKLSDKCGQEYTTKMHRMMQDTQTYKNMNKEFDDWLTTKKLNSRIEFHTKVLSNGQWPCNTNEVFQEMIMPNVFQTHLDKFHTFYNERHQGRKLTWIYNMCKVDFVTHCFKNQYVVTTNIYIASVFLQFNDKTEFTIGKLKKAVGFNDIIFDQVVQILVKSRFLVLEKASESSSSTQSSAIDTQNDKSPYSENDIVKLYFDYRNRRTKLNLNAPLRHEVKVEQESTSKAVEDDRKYEIQCCIVRIMKARKKINFNNLMTEVIAQLKHRFQPQIPVIKKAVDTLIDKDYLERDANERNTFSYIA